MPYLSETTRTPSKSLASHSERPQSLDHSHSHPQLSSQLSFRSHHFNDLRHSPAVDFHETTAPNDPTSTSSRHHRCYPHSCQLLRRCTECRRKQCRFFNFLNISSKCAHPSRLCFSCLLLYICRQALTFRRDMSISPHPDLLRRRETDPSRSNHDPDESGRISRISPSSSHQPQLSPTPVICPEPSCPHVMSGRLARYAASKFCKFVQGGSTDSSFISTTASSSTISSVSTVLQSVVQFDSEVAAIAGLPRACRACLRTEPDSFFRPLTTHCRHSPRLCTPCIHTTLRLHFATSSSHTVRCPWPFCRHIVTPQDIYRVYDPLSNTHASQMCPSISPHLLQSKRLTIALNIADLTIPRATLEEELAVEVAAEYQRRMASATCNSCHNVRRMSEFPFPMGWPCVHALYACQHCVAAQIPNSVRQVLLERAGFHDVSVQHLPVSANRISDRENYFSGKEAPGEGFPAAFSSPAAKNSKENFKKRSIHNHIQNGSGGNGKAETLIAATVLSHSDHEEFLELPDDPPHLPIVRCLAPKCAAILPFAALASIDLTLAQAVGSPHSVKPQTLLSPLTTHSNSVPVRVCHSPRSSPPLTLTQHSVLPHDRFKSQPMLPPSTVPAVDVILWLRFCDSLVAHAYFRPVPCKVIYVGLKRQTLRREVFTNQMFLNYHFSGLPLYLSTRCVQSHIWLTPSSS